MMKNIIQKVKLLQYNKTSLYSMSIISNSNNKQDKRILDMKKKDNFKFNFKEFLDNIDWHERNIKNRKSDVDIKKITNLHNLHQGLTNNLNLMRQKSNDLQKRAKQLSISGEKLPGSILKDLSKNQQGIAELLKEYEKTEKELMEEVLFVPNFTSPESPIGDETKNKIIFKNKEIPQFDFETKSHLELAENLNLLDFTSASKVAGAKFVYLKNDLVLLEQALINYTLGKLRKKGYSLITTPDLVKNEVIEGCGFSPRDKNKSQIYQIDDNELSLIGTSEIPIMGLMANELLNKKDLPIKYAGLSHCFRREAGRGEKSKGLYRLHQFTKVEMFAFTEDNIKLSEAAQLEMLEIQKEIFNELGLSYIVLEMSTEELGSSAYRKFDIEAYFPSFKDYGEISSCSNCIDYQSRRLLAQYWDSNKKYLHSVNGTAMAIPRILMSIMENFQTKEGSIKIPACLVNYMHGIEEINRSS